jgi:hypothetical protein
MSLKKTSKFLIIGICLLFESLGFCADKQYYSTLDLGVCMNGSKTYDQNSTERQYPYKFSSVFTKFGIVVGSHINDSYDIGLEVLRFSNIKHKYNGPIMEIDPQPYKDFIPIAQPPKDHMAKARQKINSTVFMLSGKKTKNIQFLDYKSDLYFKGGIGLALNQSDDYRRVLGGTVDIRYPGDTQQTFALNLGLGLQKKIDLFSVGFGYDFYRLGRFKTQDRMVLYNLENQPIISAETEGKKLKPSIMVHSISLSLSYDL